MKDVYVTLNKGINKQEFIDSCEFECVDYLPYSNRNLKIVLPEENINNLDDFPLQISMIGSPEENNIFIESDYIDDIQVSANDSTIDANEVNYGLAVCSLPYDNIASSGLTSAKLQRTTLGENVDVVILDPGNVLRDHPEFLDDQGNTRVVEIDWVAVTGLSVSGDFTPAIMYDQDRAREYSHGHCMASLVAGNRCGWVPKAKIYPLPWSDASGFNEVSLLVKKWHELKVAAGNTRRTICVQSTSGSTQPDYFNVRYRDTHYALTPADSAATKAQYKLVTQFNSGGDTGKVPVYNVALNADYDDMIDAGVIFCVSAGNRGAYIAKEGDADWDNAVQVGATTYTFYNKGWCTQNAIICGNIDVELNNGRRVIQSSSSRGPGIGIYAPGQQTVAACTSGTNKSNPYVSPYSPTVKTQYPNSTDPDHLIGKFGGTSAAAPQVAGVAAYLADAYPSASPQGIKTLIEYQHLKDRVYLPAIDFTDPESLWGDTGRYLSAGFSYPEFLPLPVLEGYSLAPMDSIIRSELSTGLVVQRDISKNPTTEARLRWIGTPNEVSKIHAWLEKVAGYQWWNINLTVPAYASNQTALHRVRLTRRIGQINRLGTMWELSADIQIIELDTIDVASIYA